jgi:replicative DNA helicase
MKMKITAEQLKAQLKLAQGGQDSKMPDLSLDDIESFGNKASLRDMLQKVHNYNAKLKEQIMLVNDQLSSVIPFTKESLYLFCAYTGSGKSTVAANISYPLWKQGKKILVISNEETEQDVIFRIACIELKLNFNDYKNGVMSTESQLKALALFPQISEFVKVKDVSYQAGSIEGVTTKVEGIKKLLELVKHQTDYSCVVIDYYQLIKYSIADSKKTSYENLNDLRIWLGQYIKSSTMPVVLFVQLYSQSKRQSKGGDIDNRVKDCSAIVEPATVIIEIVPNYDAGTSDFIIHKNRFGQPGKVTCGFEHGRYISLSDDEVVDRELRGSLKKQDDKFEKLKMMVKTDVDKKST